MADRRVLLISYWFPPAGGIAVQRALSLARYLPQHGCEVHVLAPKNPPSPVLDPTLLSKIPAEVKVHRAWTPSPSAQTRRRVWSLLSRNGAGKEKEATASGNEVAKPGAMSKMIRRILCPDPEVVWVPFAKRRARQIVRRHKIDTAIVTAPPFSAFLIGNALKKEFPSLRLVADFRDEWLRFFLSTFEFQNDTYIRQRAESIERETVELSDCVVSVTTPVVNELRERYSDQPGEKFVYIPNGYDPATFAGFTARPHGGSKLVITYVGTVYRTTTPTAYFEGLDGLPEELKGRIETRFVGRVAPDQQQLLDSRSDIKLLGYVSQAEALRYMEETDYLLLTMSDPTFATGKIYEYLASGKPIIAFSPPGGEVSHIIAETGTGWCLDPTDRETTRAFLSRVATGALAGEFKPNLDAIRRYERPRLAQEFAAVIRG